VGVSKALELKSLYALFHLTNDKIIFIFIRNPFCGRISMPRIYKLFLIVSLVPMLASANTYGSRKLLHVQSASTLNKGTLDFRTNLYFFTKVGDYLGEQKPANFAAVNFWNVQSNALVSYGIHDNFDLTVMWRIYQDAHVTGLESNSPEDLFIDLKGGSFGLSNNRFHLGMIGSLRIPTKSTYNYAMEFYTAGSVEYGFTGLFSFFNDPYLHDRSSSLHLNLGWYNHNDAGQILYERAGTQYKASGNSTALRYGLGFSYPTELFELNLELWGNNFINKPDTMARSRDNYMYITPAIKFKPKRWINVDLGVDIRISKDESTSSLLLPKPSNNLDLPTYPTWRLYLGLNLTLMPVSVRKGGQEGGVKSKVDFYENLLRERQKSKNVEDELRRLKKEREQAEKELEELRQMLEEEGK
jgi:hypothetical protein